LSILYLLLPIAIFFLILAIAFFFWAIKNDQYDDMESPALKIVIDDHQKKKNEASHIHSTERDDLSDSKSD